MNKPELHRIKGKKLKLNLAHWPGNGPSVICIQGITSNCLCWAGLARIFSPDLNIYALNLRERGKSDKPSKGYSVAHHIEDLLDIYQALNLKQAIVMAHSLGVYIALAFTQATIR